MPGKLSGEQGAPFSRRAMLRSTAVAGVGLAGAALVGCGGGGKPGAPAASAPGTSAASSAPAQPQVSDRFVLIQNRDAASLDPLASQVYTTPERVGLIYPRLIDVSRQPKADFADTKIGPSYAVESWEVTDAGKQITFKMRKGVKYSNTPPLNGRELVAGDVKFSFERYMTDPTSTFKARYADIDKIETPDNYTVVFKLKKPSRYVMYAISAEPSLITPPEIAKSDGDFKTKAIGPGPFLHVSTKQGEGTVLKKNPDFVDASKVYYENYLIKVITDTSTGTAALRTNEADYSPNLALSKAELKAAESPNVTSFAKPLTTGSGFWFNMQNPKWADIRARTAISKAFDRQAIIDQTQQADGSFNGPIPVGFGKWALSEKELRDLNAYKYDPAEAKKLWDAAGKPATSANKLYTAPKANAPVYTVIAELVGQQLEKNLGIKSEYSTDEYSNFVSKVYNNKFEDVAIFGMVLNDPLDYLLAQYYPGGTRNGPGLNDPKVNAMLDELRSVLDDTAAQQKAREIATHLTNNVLSMSHLPLANSFALYNAKLQNFLPGVYPPGVEFTVRSWKAK